jgi:hypothetical protein
MIIEYYRWFFVTPIVLDVQWPCLGIKVFSNSYSTNHPYWLTTPIVKGPTRSWCSGLAHDLSQPRWSNPNVECRSAVCKTLKRNSPSANRYDLYWLQKYIICILYDYKMYCNIYIYIHTYNSKTQCRKIVATLSFNHNCQTFWSFRITIGMFLTGSHRTGPVIEVQILSNNTDRLEEPADGCRAGGVLGYTHTYTHISLSVCF